MRIRADRWGWAAVSLACLLALGGETTGQGGAPGLGGGNAETEFQRGWKAYGDNDRATASACGEEGLRADPNHPGCHFLRGLGRIDRGDPAGAIEDFTCAVRSELAYDRAYLERSLAFELAGDVMRCAADAAVARLLVDDHAAPALELGWAAGMQGDWERCDRLITESLKIRFYRPRAYIWRGYARFALGRMDEALQDYNEYIRRVDQDPEGYEKRAELHQARGDWAAAQRDRTEAARRKR